MAENAESGSGMDRKISRMFHERVLEGGRCFRSTLRVVRGTVKHRLLFVCLCVLLLLSYIISCVCISVSLYYGLVAIIIRFRVLDQPLRFVRGAMKHRLLCVCLCVCYFCYRLLFLIFSLLSSSRICYHYYSYCSCHY